MPHTAHSLQIVVAMLLWLIASAAIAQPSDLQGVYVATADQSDRIDAAIEEVVSEMNFIKRPIARGRLKKTNPSYSRISIARSASHIETQFDDRKPVQMPADGRPVKWTREDGEVFEVTAAGQEGRLVQTFNAEDGRRVNTFRLSPDSRVLSLHVSITSRQLPSPMEYTLEFENKQ